MREEQIKINKKKWKCFKSNISDPHIFNSPNTVQISKASLDTQDNILPVSFHPWISFTLSSSPKHYPQSHLHSCHCILVLNIGGCTAYKNVTRPVKGPCRPPACRHPHSQSSPHHTVPIPSSHFLIPQLAQRPPESLTEHRPHLSQEGLHVVLL